MVKNLLTFLLLVAVSFSLQAQSQTLLDKSMRYVEQKAATWELTSDDYQGALVSDIYTDQKSGNTYIYLQQSIDGTPIANAVTAIMISKSGEIHNVGSRFIPNAKSLVASKSVNLSTTQAIKAAAEAFAVKANISDSKRSTTPTGTDVFEGLDFVHNDVKVKKEYAMLDDKLVLVYDMSLDLKGSADYWNAKVSAADGSLVAKHNYTIYCKHDHGAFGKHNTCSAAHRAEKKDAVSLTSANAALMMGATYNVFSLPAESPIHGERVTISDNEFPDQSPYGWHDTDGEEGAEHTITRGNNVWAFTDREGTDFSSNNEPDGGMDLVFDFPYDLNNEADVNESTSVVNLFTSINQIHDITGRLGFTPASGAFQDNNYGAGGQGGDAIRAHGFDGFELAEPTLNNANFSTPPDGSSGRMQMFLWENSGGVLSIDAPVDVSGFINPVGTADYGQPVPAGNQMAITGAVGVARDADPASPTTTCGDVANPQDLAGKIAIVDRGLCNFSLKSFNVQQAGAVACIICNVAGADGAGSSGETVGGMTGGDRADEVTIPTVMVAKSVCDRIRSQIEIGNEVTMTMQTRDPVGPSYRDASFDLGVVAHENGHGVSNRLIGGPTQAGCLTSAEQMGEGVSDLLALILTVEEGDEGTDPRGIGNYVDYLPPAGPGIRTYPYSTDLNINPRTYEELPGFLNADGEPLIYSVGEVWTIAAWEMYWQIVDKKGLDITWTDETAGNFIAGRLIMEGMKLVPCNPSLIDMRNGILAADAALYNKEHELEIWTAFAKRGLGWNATGAGSNSITDGEADFEIFPLAIQTLKIDKSAEVLVNAGDAVTITLTANNHVPETKDGIYVEDVLPEGATFVAGSESMAVVQDGATLRFDIGSMDYEDEVVITYDILIDAGVKSNTLFLDNVDDTDQSTYDIELLEGFNIWSPTTIEANSGELSLYVEESGTEENDQTITINNVPVNGNNPVLRFFHKYDTQTAIDGGFVRISRDGEIFELVNDKFIRNGYDSDLSYQTFAIPNLRGFSGSTDGEWIDSYVDLTEYKGENISIQFRFGSDEMTAAQVATPGWFVDDIEIFDLKAFSSVACINSAAPEDMQCSGSLDFIVNSNGVVSTINEDYGHLSVGFAPNPASEYVTISVKSPKGEKLAVELTTIEGKIISRQSINNATNAIRTFDVSNLQSGMYFMTVRDQNAVVTTQKIVVN